MVKSCQQDRRHRNNYLTGYLSEDKALDGHQRDS